MNKPIIGAISAVMMLCVPTAQACAKPRALPARPPETSQIVETAHGFVIRTRGFDRSAVPGARAAIRLGSAVKVDAALLEAPIKVIIDANR